MQNFSFHLNLAARYTLRIRYLLALFLCFISTAQANTTLSGSNRYILDNNATTINFLSTKKLAITEIHQFTQKSGSINQDGSATLVIDLTSVDTNIAIRDQRLQNMLFNTALFPQAKFTTKLPLETMKKVESGTSELIAITGTLSLHGITQEIQTSLKAYKDKQDQLHVYTVAPIIIDSKSFKLNKAVDALRDIAGLSSITYTIPVTFDLTFAPVND